MSRSFAKHEGGMIVDAVGTWRTDRALLTASDAARLRATLTRAARWPAGAPEAAGLLAAALRSAVVVPPDRVPADVVTMRSRVVLKDVETGRRREVVLVYPEEELAHDRHVSVLSPMGVALLGLNEGALVSSTRPDGGTAVLRVEAVGYQPEAAEEFHL